MLSAVGEIKSVDFFIENNPIDLKVTYFPGAYMQGKLKEALGNTELTWLKRQAKKYGITPDKNLSDSEQYHFLKEEIENQPCGHLSQARQVCACGLKGRGYRFAQRRILSAPLCGIR